MKNVKKVAASFKQDRLRVRIEDTKLRIQTFGFTHPDIELKKCGVRAVDVPMDAAVIDVLELMKLFSAEELGESGLAARIMEAQEQAIQSIESAHFHLKAFGVPREAVNDLLDAHVALHARALKAILARSSADEKRARYEYAAPD